MVDLLAIGVTYNRPYNKVSGTITSGGSLPLMFCIHVCLGPIYPLITGGTLLPGLGTFGHIPFLRHATNVWDGRFHPWME